MRCLLKFKLRNSLLLFALIHTSTKKESRRLAIVNSQFLPESYTLDWGLFVGIENWEIPQQQTQFKSGKHRYAYFIVENQNIIENGRIDGQGVKSAFNNINLISQNINTTTTIIYLFDLDQQYKIKDLMKRSSLSKAVEILKSKEQTTQILERAVSKVQSKNIRLFEVTLIKDMIMDYIQGRYKGISTQTIIGAMAAMLYFLSPFDLIPDFIPGIGQVDDLTVLAYTIKAIKEDLSKYEQWRINKNLV